MCHNFSIMDFLDVNTLLNSAGLVGLLSIVFVETGLLVGFFLPGDSLLFTAGVLSASDKPFAPIWLLCILIPIAAIIGDQVGFFIGRKLGPMALKSPAIKWIGQEQVERTNAYFDKYGPVTVLIARFIAIVRTLTPLMAGVSSMPHKTFTLYSVAGSVLWGAGVPILGYFLGQIPFVKNNIGLILMGAIAVILVPMFIHVGRTWWKVRSQNSTESE